MSYCLGDQLRNIAGDPIFDLHESAFLVAAADRIETLEAALREIVATNRLPACDMARRALEPAS